MHELDKTGLEACLRKQIAELEAALYLAKNDRANLADNVDRLEAELEAALDGALDTILEHTLADSRPVTEEDQPAIDAFDRAVEEGRARLASRLLNKEDRNG